MSIELTKFLPLVLPRAKGCPDELAIDEIRYAIGELCNRSEVWREDVLISAVDGQAEYPLMPSDPVNSQIDHVVFCSYDGQEIFPVTEDQLDASSRTWRSTTGDPSNYLMTDPETIRLFRTPDADLVDGLVVKVALAPADAAVTTWDLIYTRYRNTVIHGALKGLLNTTAQPWGDAKMAQVYEAMFDRDISKITIARRKSYTRANLSVRMAPMAYGRRNQYY